MSFVNNTILVPSNISIYEPCNIRRPLANVMAVFVPLITLRIDASNGATNPLTLVTRNHINTDDDGTVYIEVAVVPNPVAT